MNQFYRPSGELQGDKSPLPSRGTETGMSGHDTACGGADKAQDATNRKRGIAGATTSDPLGRNMPPGE